MTQIHLKRRLLAGAACAALVLNAGAPMPALAAGQGAGQGGGDRPGDQDQDTVTPIKHVILIIGENRSFDHVFATYEPQRGQSVRNLLSEGIVTPDGAPGPNYTAALQNMAEDPSPGSTFPIYQASPGGKSPFATLPPPLAGGPKTISITSLAQAKQLENGLADDYYRYLLTGGTGLAAGTPDTRISYAGQAVDSLPPGPFQLTPGVPYDAYAASPVHRFYQMWQQSDCSLATAGPGNASGCLHDLVPWVEVTVGAGTNGLPRPANYSDATTREGSTAMAFYNMRTGDAPYLKYLADTYSMSDNYHQAAMGGTGANHIMLGFADAIWFSDGNGHPMEPPNGVVVAQGTANQGTVNEIEDPDPAPGTNNWYTEDGYGGGSYGSPSYGGGSYSECADPSQPGVGVIVDYLKSLPRRIDPNCEPNHAYLLNNYNPGYFGDGSNAATDPSNNNTVFTIPPTSVRNIGDALGERHISWRYYGDQWNRYLKDKYQLLYTTTGGDQYCTICNPFQYATSIMADAQERTEHLKDTADLYQDIQNGWLPAVSYVKPSGYVDGHPASSKLDLFEGFVKKIVDLVQSQPKLWKDTAIFITFDEGGGYYDSGYIQPLDFFGDGTRIPMLVVSRYSTGGRISHVYADHVSFLKFVEANWRLRPLTNRSRDNDPNPIARDSDPYVPTNSPAIGDLVDLFDFRAQGPKPGAAN